MNIRNLLVCSTATAGLAGFLAMSAFAQDSDNAPQYSTPQERAQTQALNQQAIQGTTASPTALNGEGGDPNAPSAANQARREEYRDQQAQYHDEQDRYRVQRAQYEHDLHRYDRARWEFGDYPHAYAYRYDDARLRPVNTLAEPSEQLAHAPVEGPDGRWVGRVRNIEIGVDGHPIRVEVALNRRVSVWVRPHDLRFDAADKILFTDLTRSDLWNLPGNRYEM